jgi:hypothetical protein
MPSKQIDHIEMANSKSIGEFIDEYLPPSLVLPTPTAAASETVSKLRLKGFLQLKS